MKYRVIHASVTGEQNWGKGKVNEDTKIVDRVRNIYILADGMGGQEVGKTASYTASQFMYCEMMGLYSALRKGSLDPARIEGLLKRLTLACNGLISATSNDPKFLRVISRKVSSLRSIVAGLPDSEAAQKSMDELNENLGKLVGISSRELLAMETMGTTLDSCIIYNHTAYWCHVGNGRLYKVTRKGKRAKISRLTEEHVDYPSNIEGYSSIEQTVIETGAGLTSHLGLGGDIRVDTDHTVLGIGDIFYMATDGITHAVSEREILEVFKPFRQFSKARGRILQRAENPEKVAKVYSRMKGVPLEVAAKKVARDNKSFIAVKRMR